jgi:ParB family chromosome partitioning protein
MILAGHRRYFAALKLNLTQVPVRVLSSSNNQELVPLIENLQREDLSVLEVADYFLQCQKKHGMNLASIAAITGISNTTVGKYIRLAEGPPEIRERVERDDIPLDAAFELLRHGPELIREVVKLPVVTKQIVRDRAKGNTVPPNEQRLTKQDRTRLEFGRMIEKLEDVDAGLDRYRHMRTAQSSIRQAQAHIRQASMKILEEMVDKDKREPQSAETFNRSSLLNSTL